MWAYPNKEQQMKFFLDAFPAWKSKAIVSMKNFRKQAQSPVDGQDVVNHYYIYIIVIVVMLVWRIFD